jgi:ion channel
VLAAIASPCSSAPCCSRWPVHAFFTALPLVAKPSEWLLAVSLAGILLATEARPRALMVLGAILAFARLPQSFLGAPSLVMLSQTLWGVSCLMATIVAVTVAFRRGRVGSERIFAVLGAYLLTGLIFGIAFGQINDLSPGAFRLPTPETARFEHAVYMSFVVLTSLGFGDVVPISPIARGLTILEAVIGQLYLAVLVARLVSLYSAEEFARYMDERSQRRRRPPP